jgi:hypothetical protein
MSLLHMWAQREGVSPDAIRRLEALIGVAGGAVMASSDAQGEPGSESRQQSLIRLEAARRDILLFRNNSGALQDKEGRFIRFGLANESEKMNARIKSSDLIGIEKVTIAPWMVGSVIGRFVAVECKKEGWVYRTSDARAVAQLTFIDLINSYGGRALFATGAESL